MPDDLVYTLVVTFVSGKVDVLERIGKQTTLLAQAILSTFNGFLASRILLSREGHRVVIVSDWASKETLSVAQTDARVTAIIAQHVEETDSIDVHIYERVATVTTKPSP